MDVIIYRVNCESTVCAERPGVSDSVAVADVQLRVVEALREWSVASASDESMVLAGAAVGGQQGTSLAFSRALEKLTDLRALAEALAHRISCLRAAGFLLPEPLLYLQAVGSAVSASASASGAHVKLEMP